MLQHEVLSQSTVQKVFSYRVYFRVVEPFHLCRVYDLNGLHNGSV